MPGISGKTVGTHIAVSISERENPVVLDNYTMTLLESNKKIFWSITLLTGIVAACFSYNLYTSFFPVSLNIIGDDAEHLHVAYLLGQGQRPFIDFMEHHPMLYNQYLWWLHEITGVTSVATWNIYARATVFIHFLLCLLVFYLWTSRLIKRRPDRLPWIALLLLSWAMTGLYNPYFHWIFDIRPDFICYAYTLLGCYLVYLYFSRLDYESGFASVLLLVFGGALIGFGNAVLPKGTVIILAIVLTLVTSQLSQGNQVLSCFRNKKIVKSLFIVGVAVGVSFLGGVFLDCYLGGIRPDKWIAAVLVLNAQEHLIYTRFEHNPVTSITNAFSLNFFVLLALVVLGVWALSRIRSQKRESPGEEYIGLFSLFVIVINLLMPTYTNGVACSYYFIPSIFAAALIYMLILLKVWGLLSGQDAVNWHGLRGIALFAGFAFILLQAVLPQYIMSVISYQIRQEQHGNIEAMTKRDFLREETLPASFVYLALNPRRMPVKARHWGYYSMLVRDKDFWKDCHRLGLGPDPQETWGNGFGENPPDALAFSSTSELLEFVLSLEYCQGIDGTWLLDEVKNNYVFMNTKGQSIYVRLDRVPYLQERGWHMGKLDQSFLASTSLNDQSR